MRIPTRNVLCAAIAFLFSVSTLAGQILQPFLAIPAEQRDGFANRLDGYVDAYRHRDWKKLYGFASSVGKGGVDLQTFVIAMSSNHGEDFAQYPDLQEFAPTRTRKNADGYDIYGCGRAVREGDRFRGIAEVHAVFEHDDWFFTGWTFRDSSDESCAALANPDWQPPSAIKWNGRMKELEYLH